jgi:hypothetical protein
MQKLHGGFEQPQGVLNRGTKPQPSPTHGGTNSPKGVTRSPQPQIYGAHGGTNLPRVLNKKK